MFVYLFILVELLIILSNRPARCGGQHGGEKFMWRGILFKLADGSRGPYCGNDEAAAKGEGRLREQVAIMWEKEYLTGAP